MTELRTNTRDCPHEEFEPVKKPALYLPPVHRCKDCGLVWANSTPPVQAWAARTGAYLPGSGKPSSDGDEREPF